MKRAKAVSAVNKSGILLVFPITNKKEPPSLWSNLWPRSEMRWEWDEGGDNRVAQLWHLREELSRSREVVYTKWYQGRATLFSKQIFTSFLCILQNSGMDLSSLSSQARELYSLLLLDSPLSTKQLKQVSGLVGRAYEADYHRTLKELWARLLIVGYGEVDEGAFPSLAVGTTETLFEELWLEAQDLNMNEAWDIVDRQKNLNPLFIKNLKNTLSKSGKQKRGNTAPLFR